MHAILLRNTVTWKLPNVICLLASYCTLQPDRQEYWSRKLQRRWH